MAAIIIRPESVNRKSQMDIVLSTAQVASLLCGLRIAADHFEEKAEVHRGSQEAHDLRLLVSLIVNIDDGSVERGRCHEQSPG